MSSTSRAVTGACVVQPHHRGDDLAGLAFVDLWVRDEVMEVHVEQAGGVLGPLDVAADPEQRLCGATQHGPTCCCCSACSVRGPASGATAGTDAATTV